jgi:hypothetical protein
VSPPRQWSAEYGAGEVGNQYAMPEMRCNAPSFLTIFEYSEASGLSMPGLQRFRVG